jgi:ABC-type multidrug transport system fused ATPase/permease subunit
MTRSLTQFARSSSIWRTSLFKMFWIGFLYSTTYAAQPLTADGAINLQTCFYFALMFGILGNLRGIATLFDERSLYEHERTSRAYEPIVYFTVTTFAQMPWLLFMNLLFSSLVFWSIGLWKLGDAFWVYIWYLCITALTNLIGFAWAQMLAAYTSSQAIAMSVWQPGVYIWSQTSGFPINPPTISHSNPAWMLMSISFTRWAYEAIILGVFWNGWGPETQKDIFKKYGYTNTPLWTPLPFMLLFPVLVRLVTYFPLLEKKSNLETLGGGDYAGAVRDAEEKTTGTASSAISVTEDDTVLEGKSDGEQGGFVEAPKLAVVAKGVYYSVRLTNEQGAPFVKPLLRDVSCDIQPGELLAVMGPSGAGKSTFLDWLAGRKTTGFGKANLKYNGTTPTFEQRSTCEAYVMQHDVMIPTLTVSETLRVACMLRLGRPMLV